MGLLLAAVVLLSILGVFSARPASGATNNGTATLTQSSGTGATNFTINLGGSASCPGDGNAGYRWQTFMIPAAADIDATLTFGTTGGISGIPNFNFQVFSPTNIPDGAYNIGVACTLGAAGSTQLKSYWSQQITITNDATNQDNAKVDWIVSTPVQTTTTTAAPTTTTTAAPTTTTTAAPTTTTTLSSSPNNPSPTTTVAPNPITEPAPTTTAVPGNSVPMVPVHTG